MTLAEVLKFSEAAFGEGSAKHGYSRADNWEATGHKLRHAFWEGATFEAIKPGVLKATLESGAERIVFVK
jgi:hypothetical protein